MPYEGEFASYRPLRRIVESQRVRELLGNYRVRDYTGDVIARPTLVLANVQPSNWMPHYVIAVDGSYAVVPIRNGFPGAEAAYVTVASVLLDIAKMHELDRYRPIDPQEFRATEQAESIDSALPGCNVVYEGDGSAKESLRRAIYQTFASVRMSSDGESLLDTYEALLGWKPSMSREQKCPYDDCPIPDGEYRRGRGTYMCQCSHARPLYSTDALRIHEGMLDAGTNGAMFAEIMQVWERVWILHILRTLEAKTWLSSLRRLAIVLDGPLAVFGHPAWLSQAISKELCRLNRTIRQATRGQDVLLIGIEKGGMFAEHLDQIDQADENGVGVFPRQTAGLITDEYIKRNIIFSDSSKTYGKDTYFGRKFLYKAASGARVVALLPFLSDDHRDMTRAEPSQYPRLADTLNVLDHLVSSRFANALTPLIAAHAEAAIPLNLGKKVLEDLARRMMGEHA